MKKDLITQLESLNNHLNQVSLIKKDLTTKLESLSSLSNHPNKVLLKIKIFQFIWYSYQALKPLKFSIVKEERNTNLFCKLIKLMQWCKSSVFKEEKFTNSFEKLIKLLQVFKLSVVKKKDFKIYLVSFSSFYKYSN